jgi:hypothetical protein
MTSKQRLSASVDSDLLEAGAAAVAAGRASNLSAWVNEALRRQAEHDRRMSALDEFFAAFDSEHDEITSEEIRDATRVARSRSVVVRGDLRDLAAAAGVHVELIQP